MPERAARQWRLPGECACDGAVDLGGARRHALRIVVLIGARGDDRKRSSRGEAQQWRAGS
jgi:hypothetical protein